MDDISRQLKELDKEIDESCLTAKQCLNVIKSMKGRLPLDLNALFDVFIDQDIGKIKEATISVEYIDEAEGILATLLNQIVPVKALLLGNDEAEQPIIKVYAQPKARDPFFWLETAENQIERLLIVLQALKKVRVNRSAFLQKFNDLKQANASSLWLDDLQQLEEYLTVKLTTLVCHIFFSSYILSHTHIIPLLFVLCRSKIIYLWHLIEEHKRLLI